MTIKAILFDKDGTLIDFDATFAPATLSVIRDLSGGDEQKAAEMADHAEFDANTLAISRNSFLLAGSLDDIGEAWFRWAKPGEALMDFVSRIDELYIRHSAASVAAFPFLHSTLDELADRGLALGVATNDSEAAAQKHLSRINVLEKFVFVAGYDSGYGAKPGGGMVTAFCETLGLLPAEVAMVGDTLHDCQAGRTAGTRTIAVTSGQTNAARLHPHADHVLADISDIPSLLDQLEAAHD